MISTSASALEFLGSINDQELRGEIRNVLTKLQLLSETHAMTFSIGHSSEKPIGPPSFKGLSESDCPSKDRSLYEHFVWRFRNLVESHEPRKKFWFLLWEAETDNTRRAVSPTEEELLERRALEGHRPTQNTKQEDALAAHIVSTTEGIHSYKVSLELNFPQGWIEKIRELAGCEPVMGRPRPAWRQLTSDRKRELVGEQQQLGRTQKEAAQILGCGERTVRDYWPSRVAA